MGQWEEKLGAILNNPQAMSQIMSLAQSLGGQGEAQDTPDTETPSASPEAGAEGAQGQVWTPVDSEPAADTPLPGLELDPRLMEAGMRALSVWNDPDDPRAALLRALRPFLKEERRGKLDRAIHITRLSKAVRAALDGLQGGVRADV